MVPFEFPRFAGRLRAAGRAIGEAYRLRMRGTRHRVRLLGGRDDLMGYIDLLEIRNGYLRLCGWTTAQGLRISTELETLDLIPSLSRPDTPGTGFEVRMEGARLLNVSLDGKGSQPVSTLRLSHRVLGIVKFAGFLIAIPVRFAPEILAYISKGDQTAGERLQSHLLDVTSPEDDPGLVPKAATRIFSDTVDTEKSPPVDIVLPVHNGVDDLRVCLDHFTRNTDEHHRLLVIDDCSTDPDVPEVLREFLQERNNVEIFYTPANLGFVGAVNFALEKCSRHAILLNSDAFVPPGWVDRLVRPLLDDEGVGSATPMSNNAEILSVPVSCQSWPLAEGMVEHIDRVANTLKPSTSNSALPTGVGFCMALSRHWLERFPKFDASFGRGYGEEVDWCQKTAHGGARHVVATNLFVGHRGGASFGEEKLARLEESNREINRRYPKFAGEVERFRRRDPLVGERLALGLAAIDDGAAVPVYVIHRLGGGVEKSVKGSVASDLNEHAGAVILRVGESPDTMTLELHTVQGVTKGSVKTEELHGYLAVPSQIHLVYGCLVGAPDPLAALSRLTALLRENDKFTIAFHDYFPVCPSYNLIGANGRYCGLPDQPACGECYRALSNLSGRRPESMEEWRDAWHAALSRSNTVCVFSGDTRAHLLRVWPDLKPKITLSEQPELDHIPVVESAGTDREVVGVLGSIGYPKGAGVLQALARSTDPEVKIVVIGKLDPAFHDKNVMVHGAYHRHDISELAARYGITRWFFPSIWPETYSFAVRECLATGLPVIGFDIGAQGEVLREHPRGRTIPLETGAKALAEILNRPN